MDELNRLLEAFLSGLKAGHRETCPCSSCECNGNGGYDGCEDYDDLDDFDDIDSFGGDDEDFRRYFAARITMPADGDPRHIVYGACEPLIDDLDSEIETVIFNGPATIVKWADGVKTVVKCCDLDTYDKEKGLAMAIVKRICGNGTSFHEFFDKWCPEE